MSREAMKLALEVLKINLTLLKKINPYKGQEDLLSDSLDLTNKAINALEAELAKPDFWEGYVPEPDKRQQALDKKAENARELGLDYEPAQQEPVDFASLFHEAEEIVRQKPTWKRFIDGTPLSNDIAVWMTVFAQDVARRTFPSAQRTWVGLEKSDMPDGADPIFDDPKFIAGMVYAANKLMEKNT